MADINVRITAMARDLLNELEKIERGTKRVEDSAEKMGRDLDTATTAGGRGMSTLTKGVLALGGAFVASEFTDFARRAIDAAIEQEQAEAKITATVKSMNAETWTSVDALKAQAAAFQDSTTYGDEAVLGLQDLLLTFGNVTDRVGAGNDIFQQATSLSLDMSAALGQDLKSSAIQLGKALNDPITGLTALRRVGIQFTDQQEEQIKAMARSGDILGAQKEILAELNREFGGTAEAIAQTDAGQLQQQMNELGDELEDIGANLLPLVVSGLKELNEAVDDIRSVGGSVTGWLSDMQDKLGWLGRGLPGISAAFMHSGEMTQAQADAVRESSEAMDSARHSAAGSQRATEDHTAATRDNRRALNETREAALGAARGYDEQAEATDGATTAIHNLIAEQRAAVDPAFAAMRAARDYADAQKATNEAVAKYGEESPEAIKAAEDQALAWLDAKAAAQELSKGGYDDNREALRKLYESMGLAPEFVAALLAEFDKIEAYKFSAKTITVNTRGDIGGSSVTLPGGTIGIAQEGGHFVKGGLTLVGEQGPEIVDIPTGSTVYPTGTGPSGGGDVHITVNGFVGSELQLAAEIDRILTRRARTAGLGFA